MCGATAEVRFRGIGLHKRQDSGNAANKTLVSKSASLNEATWASFGQRLSDVGQGTSKQAEKDWQRGIEGLVTWMSRCTTLRRCFRLLFSALPPCRLSKTYLR